MIFSILFLAIAIALLYSGWKVFEKAGKPGWAIIVPVYNLIVMVEIIKKPLSWVIMMFIPIVNIVYIFKLYIEFARAFGKDTGFGLGLIFFPFVFYPMLAFGDAEYQLKDQPAAF